MRSRLVTLSLILTIVAAGYLWFGRAPVVTLHLEREYQTISGWEVTLRLWETNKEEDRFDDSWEPYGQEIFDRLVNEMGVNRVRLEIKSGVENPVDNWSRFQSREIGYLEYKKRYYEKVNDNDDPASLNPEGIQFSVLDYQVQKMLLPIRDLVEKNGEKLFINLCYVDFRGIGPQGSLSHANEPQEYAELIAATFGYLSSKYEFVPDALEIILEPNNTVSWRGENIGRGLVAAVSRLNRMGFSPEIIAPSTSHAFRAPEYFDDMITVPGVSDVLTTFSYHRYDPIPDFMTLPEIRSRAETYGLRSAMLEHTHSGSEQLNADLVEANASAWQQYGIALRLPEDFDLKFAYFYGLQPDENGDLVLGLSDSGRRLSQYFRYIRAGAIRIGASGRGLVTSPVAFRNTDGSIVVVVQNDNPGIVRIRQLPEGIYAVRFTSADLFHEALPDELIRAGDLLELVLPDSGIATIIRKL